jgi:hypothetical protein
MRLLKQCTLAYLLAMSLMLASCAKSNSQSADGQTCSGVDCGDVQVNAHAPNLAAWAALATQAFKFANRELPEIGGGAFSAADKKATIAALELGLHNAGAAKVASGKLTLETFYQYDDGQGVLLFSFAIKKKNYAIQFLRSPSGPTTVYVGTGNPYTPVDVPPTEAVDGTRVGAELEATLNKSNITLGPVNQASIGSALATALFAQGFPTSASSITFDIGGAQAGNGGNTVTFQMGALANQSIYLNFSALLQNDGTFSVNVDPDNGTAPPLYTIPSPQNIPYAGFSSSPFYFQ